MKFFWILSLLGLFASCGEAPSQDTPSTTYRALILDGQNNHYIWPKTTMMMKDYLEETGLFTVDVNRTDSVWLGIKYQERREMPLDGYIQKFPLEAGSYAISEEPIQTSDFDFDFSKYDVVISNFGASTAYWPDATKRKFEAYMRGGGGFVVVHAANNAWGDWDEFNKMIGLGAWGGRDSLTGPYVYYNDAGEVEVDASEGPCASHGLEQEYVVRNRAPEHPIMRGLPTEWMHAQDELYDLMRGPFEGATILATAYSDPEKNAPPWNPEIKGTGWNVPTMMAINYGSGRVFHTTMGHFDYSMECVGFISTLQRGAEWAATGEVTQEVPEDFPSATASVSRTWE